MESSQKIPIQQKKVNLQQWLHNFLLSFETRPYSRETSIPFMLEIEAEIPKRAFITITTYLTGQSMRFLRILFDKLGPLDVIHLPTIFQVVGNFRVRFMSVDDKWGFIGRVDFTEKKRQR